jgi:hypothetical protein
LARSGRSPGSILLKILPHQHRIALFGDLGSSIDEFVLGLPQDALRRCAGADHRAADWRIAALTPQHRDNGWLYCRMQFLRRGERQGPPAQPPQFVVSMRWSAKN